ncbi:MAG: hypothetical protein AABY27_03065, partial [Pseudomonadota bacterium]
FVKNINYPKISIARATVSYKQRDNINQQSDTTNYVLQADHPYAFLSYLNRFAEQLDLTWQLQKLLHFKDLQKYNSIKAKYGVTASIDIFKDSHSDFRKSVLAKLHPDKNPGIKDCNDDFAFVSNLREEINRPFNIQELLYEKIQAIQPFISKANIGFKAIDTAVDVTRLIYIPTIDNAKVVLLDSTYIYSMYAGINSYSSIISGYDILYKAYQGEYYQAIIQAKTTISYMLLPYMISYIGIPCVGFAYSAGIAVYTGYSAITNAYSFYNEYHKEDFKLTSVNSYKNLAEYLAGTSFQKFYDLTSKAKEYEKAAYKITLEAKGVFGQKLYEYIYSSVIEEKYDLQNKIAQGIVTQEEAEDLKVDKQKKHKVEI